MRKNKKVDLWLFKLNQHRKGLEHVQLIIFLDIIVCVIYLRKLKGERDVTFLSLSMATTSSTAAMLSVLIPFHEANVMAAFFLIFLTSSRHFLTVHDWSALVLSVLPDPLFTRKAQRPGTSTLVVVLRIGME